MGNIRSRLTSCCSSPCEDLIVELKQGKLRGREFQSVLTKTEYYAFLGIPFAKPPVGELRFQAPEPATSWDGVYDATTERGICQQVDFLFKKIVIGSEDCLYLNVFTPSPPCKTDEPKPVMVFIHGGGFCLGSGSRKAYSADYLTPRDVILVTINYRLQVLGFLNLGLPECPGNVGLKDQVLALKWVKDNIAQFGGDPENITIFGESAGGSAVHYHLLSPMSKGLFNKAIMQSGTSICSWSITYNPLDQAFDVGRRCGYQGTDKKELLQYLKKLPAKKLTVAGVDMILAYRDKYPARIANISPSVEEIKEGAFLPDFPENLCKSATPVPTIFGVNDKEGMLLFVEMHKKLMHKVREDFTLVVTDNFKVDPALVPELSTKIKQFYFGDKEVGMDTAYELIDLYTDIYFYCTYEALDFLINSDHPPYIYEFAYSGKLNFLSRLVNFNKKTKLKGAAHADELFYLFHPLVMPFHPKLEGDCFKVIENMSRMWTNFAKRGNPSHVIDWKPSTSSEPCYLQITDDLKMIEGKLFGKRLEFLKNLLDPVAKPYNIF